MRRTGTALLLGVALFTSGCFLFVKRPPKTECAIPTTPRQSFLALYSVFFRVHYALSTRTPGWPPAGLPQAVEWLRCDPDNARRPGRIRYAAVKLAAGIVALHRENPTSEFLPDFRDALKALIGPSSLVSSLDDSPAGDMGGLENDAGTIIDQSTDPALKELQRTCCPCIDSCTVGPSTAETVAEFLIKVNRGPQCIFHVIDPQCWPSVVPGYVTQTFVLGNAPPCKKGTPVCRSTSICDKMLSAPKPQPSPGQAGVPWCGLAYEDVNSDSNSWTARFRNVLKVATANLPSGATSTDATGFRADYGLCESIYWQMCDPSASGPPSCSEGKCPLTRDCGFAEIKGTGVPGWAQLRGTKRVEFKSGLPHDGNLWAPIALEVLVKETALATCVAASSCPLAATPAGCTILPGPEKCTCAKDDCMQENSVTPTLESPFCPSPTATSGPHHHRH